MYLRSYCLVSLPTSPNRLVSSICTIEIKVAAHTRGELLDANADPDSCLQSLAFSAGVHGRIPLIKIIQLNVV
jgi:hypothetical protein